jgi:hypothetical protein
VDLAAEPSLNSTFDTFLSFQPTHGNLLPKLPSRKLHLPAHSTQPATAKGFATTQHALGKKRQSQCFLDLLAFLKI